MFWHRFGWILGIGVDDLGDVGDVGGAGRTTSATAVMMFLLFPGTIFAGRCGRVRIHRLGQYHRSASWLISTHDGSNDGIRFAALLQIVQRNRFHST